jgi:moderate conductance mechanosensitive channel
MERRTSSEVGSRFRSALNLFALLVILIVSEGLGEGILEAREKADKGSHPIVLPANPDKHQVDAFLAGLTDAQVRQALRQELEKSAQSTSEPKDETSSFTNIIHLLGATTGNLKQRISDLRAGLFTAPKLLPESLVQIHPTRGAAFGVFLTLLALLSMSLGAACLEWLFARYTRKLRERLTTAQVTSWTGKTKNLLLLAFLDFMGVLVFALSLLGIFVLFFETSENVHYRRLVLLSFLAVTFIARTVVLAANMIFAPRHADLRLLPLVDQSARSCTRWVMVFVTIFGTALFMRTLLELNRADELIILGLRALSGLMFLTLAVILAYRNRPAISRMIQGVSWRCGGEPSLLGQIADYWHLLAVPYAAGLYGAWLLFILVGERELVLAIVALLLSGPLFVLVNTIAQNLLKAMVCVINTPQERKITSTEEIGTEELECSPVARQATDEGPLLETRQSQIQRHTASGLRTGAWDITRILPMARTSLSMVIAAAIGIWVLQFWGIWLPIEGAVVRAGIQILAAVILSYVAWRLISRAINRRLAEVGGVKHDEEDEMGGEGGSRVGTLLLLLRKFLFVVLMTTLIMIVLSATGIDIAPLLAGAGVVGLAIGFGSQSLVKDIVSGIFFLVDDAFRIGDYIVAGGVKGTVEHISIRSVQLRHHRGMVLTIPFSELKGVTNYSRDYIVEKLDFGVPFNTDLDKVRKIVKKINEELRGDEEFGPKILAPIKSQGVKQINDSAMTIRIKLKTKPGDQFILRREVFKRLQTRFKEAGIEFAHRHVIVRLPEEAATTSTGENAEGKAATKALSAGAAAGAAIQMAVEEELAREEASKPSSRS